MQPQNKRPPPARGARSGAAAINVEKSEIRAGLGRHFPEMQLMHRAVVEDGAAAGCALRRQAGAHLFRIGGPGAAGVRIAGTSVVLHQRAIEGVPHGRGAVQHFLEDPAVAQHAGQAGHDAFGLSLAVFCGVDHAVHIGAVLRPQGQGLQVGFRQAKLLQIVQTGHILALLHKAQQGVVIAQRLHGAGLGHAPGKHLGVFPQVKTVLHDVTLEAGFVQSAVLHPAQEFGVQALLPHRQILLHQGGNKRHLSHPQTLLSEQTYDPWGRSRGPDPAWPPGHRIYIVWPF